MNMCCFDCGRDDFCVCVVPTDDATTAALDILTGAMVHLLNEMTSTTFTRTMDAAGILGSACGCLARGLPLHEKLAVRDYLMATLAGAIEGHVSVIPGKPAVATPRGVTLH